MFLPKLASSVFVVLEDIVVFVVEDEAVELIEKVEVPVVELSTENVAPDEVDGRVTVVKDADDEY